MVDYYTKAVLTVIATALVILVGQGVIRPSSAQNVGCGGAGAPCAVFWSAPMPVYAIVKTP